MIIRSIEIQDASGVSHRSVKNGSGYFVVVAAQALEDTPNVSLGWVIKRPDGIDVYGTSTAVQGHFLQFKAGETKSARFTFNPNLALGKYFISGGAAETLTPEDEIFNYIMRDYVHNALSFVVDSDFDTGIVNLQGGFIRFRKIDENGN
jgi:hypothetical protein